MEQKKITKREYFGMVKAIVEVAEVENRDELVAFIDHEVELLAKKSASKSKADLAKATENDRLGSIVLDVLNGKSMTITDMMKSNDELGALSNQKVSAVAKKLIENGLVVKSTDKGKAYFSLKA